MSASTLASDRARVAVSADVPGSRESTPPPSGPATLCSVAVSAAHGSATRGEHLRRDVCRLRAELAALDKEDNRLMTAPFVESGQGMAAARAAEKQRVRDMGRLRRQIQAKRAELDLTREALLGARRTHKRRLQRAAVELRRRVCAATLAAEAA